MQCKYSKLQSNSFQCNEMPLKFTCYAGFFIDTSINGKFTLTICKYFFKIGLNMGLSVVTQISLLFTHIIFKEFYSSKKSFCTKWEIIEIIIDYITESYTSIWFCQKKWFTYFWCLKTAATFSSECGAKFQNLIWNDTIKYEMIPPITI